MQTIIIYGKSDKNEVLQKLIQFLKNEYHITIIEHNQIYSIGEGEPINIVCTNSLSKIADPNAIIIFIEKATLNNLKEINPFCKLILNADDSDYIKRLSSLNSNIYTCGFSPKDYITFSSREKDNVVVSLQRNIICDEGIICYPFEIPCEILSEVSDYTILSTILTLIFLNTFHEKHCSCITKIFF